MNDDYEMQPAPQAPYPVAEQAASPFGSRALGPGVNVGSVAIEQSRAIAEVQGQIIVAQQCPRNLNKAHAELMVACKSKSFAKAAFYSVPNRGSGPSIRFAEEVARVYGNFQFGHRELSRSEGRSEIEVFAWDVEKNNRSIRQITVLHVTDTKNGAKNLRDQADIDNRIANVASKQARGRILALMPKWLVEDAILECQRTIAGDNTEPLEARVRRMVTQFKDKFGVNVDLLAAYAKKDLKDFTVEDLVEMQGVFNALKDGAKASEYFGATEDKAEAVSVVAAVVDAGKALVADATPKAAATPADAPADAAKAQAPAAAPRAPRKAQPAAAATPAQPAAEPAAKPTPQAEPQAQATVDPSPADSGPPATDDPGPGPQDVF